MLKPSSMQYNILTTVVGFDIISQVDAEGPNVHDTVMRNVINTQDAGIRQALIELGWTPPPTTGDSKCQEF